MTPPRLAVWLLARLVDRAAAEAISGDLAEEFGRRAAASGVGRARLWFWRETLIAGLWRLRREGASQRTSRKRAATDVLWTETRQVVRSLWRAPGLSLGVVIPLALALALTTSVFAVVHAVLLRDLPFPRPDRLVVVGEHDPGDAIANLGYSTFVDLGAAATSLDGLAAVRGWGPTLTAPATVRLAGLRVTSGFFSMLGVRPALGRDFTPADDTPTTRRVVILSDGLWRRQFGADPSVIDRPIEISETEYRVIGVLPASFEPVVSSTFYAPAEIWSPLGYAPDGDSSCRSCRHLKALGSIKAGVTLAAAEAELGSVHASLVRQFPADYGSTTVVGVERLLERVGRPVARPLYVLLTAVLLVLAIAGANASSLLIARGADLEHEQALRAALGASRTQIARRRVLEALLLAAAAGVAGIAGGQALTMWLVAQAPSTLPRADHIGLNISVALFAITAVVVTGAISALFPALQGAARPGATSTRSRTTDGRALVRVREMLIVIDVAIALTLAIGAGAMVRSVGQLLAVNPGFDPANVHTASLSLVGPRWADDDAVRAFQRDLLARISTMPGVERVALTGQVPLGGNYDRRGGYLEERNTGRAEDEVDFERYSVTAGYLSLMGIPLGGGRDLTDADREGQPRVMLVNEAAGRKYWPDQDPVGRRVKFGGNDEFVTVVGVVGNVRHYALDEPAAPQMYMPQAQMTDSFLVLVVRTTTFDGLIGQIQAAVRALGPDVPVYNVRPMSVLVEQSAATRRFTATLLGLFAGVAGLMMAAGLYGLVAYMVTRRTREFGIRLALGAPKAGIRRLVIARGGLLTMTGAALGIAAALPLTRLLGDQLFETSATDANNLALGLAVLAITSAIAHLVPVARATRVSPTIALRGD